MAHQTVRSGYRSLVERLNRFPQGAPPSERLYRILALLFTEREAELVALLPIRPFDAARAARAWRIPEAEARAVLDRLAARAILLDIETPGADALRAPPPMAGFFEFSMMRVRHDLDQKALAELFYQYLNVEEDFIKALFTVGETQLGRTFVHEPALAEDLALHVLDHERASEVVRRASHIGIGTCYCRHKMQHVGRACDAPMDICMTFDTTAASLIRHGFARQADAAEGLEILARARTGASSSSARNVRERVNFICNCCGCCCEAMIAARRFGHLHPVHTTNYLPRSGTGTAAAAAVRRRLSRRGDDARRGERSSPPRRARGSARRDDVPRLRGVRGGLFEGSPPTRGAVRAGHHPRGLDAQGRPDGDRARKLQNLVFDNQALASHRAMAAILGAILRLPPVKRAMASRQLRSRYLEALLARRERASSSRVSS